VLRGARH
jgi:hypothetical protein